MKKEKHRKIHLLKKETYWAIIGNSCGSQLWRNNYALVNGKKRDLVANGKMSCSFFVSSILKLFDLISNLHLTVAGLEKDLIESGWKEVVVSSTLPRGSILIWKKQKPFDKSLSAWGKHSHAGFYWGQEKAVSIAPYHSFPIIHHWTYHNTREIIRAYTHKFLRQRK